MQKYKFFKASLSKTAQIDPNYQKSKYYFSLDEYWEDNGQLDRVAILKRLDIDYVDDTWTKADWAITFIASSHQCTCG